jgi:predicted ATPase/Tfp pilus assembly protein PilF
VTDGGELGRPRAWGDEFVGRARDLAELEAAFDRGARLLTLWGPAGIGKTRLAREHTARSARPALFCELTRAESVESMLAEVALVLGLQGPQPIAETGHALAARGPLLVVLDNFEQLVAGAHDALPRWLASAPELRLLVTSRERLRIRGETTHELAPLGVPERDVLDGSDAAALFVARVRARDGSFSLGLDAAARVAAIVRRLDGIPLAIELAAARVDVLGLDELATRLIRSLDVLGGGWRASEPRQATLRGAIEWSLRLLDDDDHRALAECAVFRAPFTLRAAEAVLSPPPHGTVLDRIQSLRDKSLLARGPGERLTMLHSVRELAREQLDALLDARAVRDRHARWASSRGSAAPPGRDDVFGAIDHLLETGREEEAASAIVDAEPALARSGPQEDLLARLDRLVVAKGVGDDARVRLLGAQGRALQLAGRLDDARAGLEDAVERAAELGSPSLEAALVTDLGVLFHQMRETDRARACYMRAIALERGAGDTGTQARLLANLGALHHDLREWDEAREHYAEALLALGDASDPRLAGITLTNLAVLAQERGGLAEAAASYARALEILERSGDRRLVAIARTNLGSLHHERGDLDEAIAAHRAAIESLRFLGDVRSEALCLARLGAALACGGEVSEAERTLARARSLIDETADVVSHGAVRVFDAFIALARADLARAAGDDAAVQHHLATVRERVASAHERDGGDVVPSLAERSDDVRLALRLLAAGSARLLVDPGEGRGDAQALLVTDEARWFRPPGSELQDLRRHALLRRILLAVLEQRRVAPGRGLSVDALVRAAWPGERIKPDAAANRVYVAVAKLRRRGLGTYLLRNDEGYLLDASVPVRRTEPPE